MYCNHLFNQTNFNNRVNALYCLAFTELETRKKIFKRDPKLKIAFKTPVELLGNNDCGKFM